MSVCGDSVETTKSSPETGQRVRSPTCAFPGAFDAEADADVGEGGAATGAADRLQAASTKRIKSRLMDGEYP